MLFDSNLMIYLTKPGYDGLRVYAIDNLSTLSDITRLEVLGYPKIGPLEEGALSALIAKARIVEVKSYIITRAIFIRRKRNMSVGDAIIAATALEHKLKLATHNTKDFDWIPGLDIIDPLAE